MAGFRHLSAKREQDTVEAMNKPRESNRSHRSERSQKEDAFSRQLREAARLLLDFYLWRKRKEQGDNSPDFDDEPGSPA
jgi:hypothetical protein